MRRSSPLLDRRNERGQPRTTVLVEIDSEGVLVNCARSRAAIAQEGLELPALPAVLDPDQQLPHVAPVLTPADSRANACSLELCRPCAGPVPGSARKGSLRMFSSVIANDDRLHDPVVPRIGLFGSRRRWVRSSPATSAGGMIRTGCRLPGRPGWGCGVGRGRGLLRARRGVFSEQEGIRPHRGQHFSPPIAPADFLDSANPHPPGCLPGLGWESDHSSRSRPASPGPES
jgi:hypothetical protein